MARIRANYVRYLDIDDLIILSSILKPTVNFGKVAKSLGITPPALSHRLVKYRNHIPDFDYDANVKYLSNSVVDICTKARLALNALEGDEHDD